MRQRTTSFRSTAPSATLARYAIRLAFAKVVIETTALFAQLSQQQKLSLIQSAQENNSCLPNPLARRKSAAFLDQKGKEYLVTKFFQQQDECKKLILHYCSQGDGISKSIFEYFDRTGRYLLEWIDFARRHCPGENTSWLFLSQYASMRLMCDISKADIRDAQAYFGQEIQKQPQKYLVRFASNSTRFLSYAQGYLNSFSTGASYVYHLLSDPDAEVLSKTAPNAQEPSTESTCSDSGTGTGMNEQNLSAAEQDSDSLMANTPGPVQQDSDVVVVVAANNVAEETTSSNNEKGN
jgi:hypothetical protein